MKPTEKYAVDDDDHDHDEDSRFLTKTTFGGDYDRTYNGKKDGGGGGVPLFSLEQVDRLIEASNRLIKKPR